MRFRFVTLLAVGLGGFPAAVAADDQAVIDGVTAARAALGQAFATKDDDKIREIYASDHVSVSSFYGPPLDVDEQIAAFSKLKETIVSATTPVIDPIGSEAALVNFENTFKGTYAGKPLPERVYVSEIWIKEDGRWRQRLYQETPIE